jgi:hypothetical protein
MKSGAYDKEIFLPKTLRNDRIAEFIVKSEKFLAKKIAYV